MMRRKNRRSCKKKLIREFGKTKDASFPSSLKKFIDTNKDSIVKTVNILNPSESVKSRPVSEKIIHWFVGTSLGKWAVSKITERLIEDENSRAKIVHIGMDAFKEKLFGKTSV